MGEIELCVSVQFTCFLSFEDARCRAFPTYLTGIFLF